MYALPEQTLDAALADLEQALELEPAHVSHYQLTLEPGTAFERRPPRLPDEDEAYAMQVACQSRLAAAGFEQYEVSAYASGARECRHNLNYWRFGDYLGIGAGAHGKLTDPIAGSVTRTARVRQPGRYLGARLPVDRVDETRVLSADDLAFEFCLNALRLVAGFDAELFEARTGLPWSVLAAPLAAARARGLVTLGADRKMAPTTLGRQFLNDLQAIFLPAHANPGGSGRPGLLALPDTIG
jgi:oxygen-independent coproporphyrinogen-3 oxidase